MSSAGSALRRSSDWTRRHRRVRHRRPGPLPARCQRHRDHIQRPAADDTVEVRVGPVPRPAAWLWLANGQSRPSWPTGPMRSDRSPLARNPSPCVSSDLTERTVRRSRLRAVAMPLSRRCGAVPADRSGRMSCGTCRPASRLLRMSIRRMDGGGGERTPDPNSTFAVDLRRQLWSRCGSGPSLATG